MSDNEEYVEASTSYKPSFILIAIDTDPSMFIKNEDETKTPFQHCIEVCYDLANSLLFTKNTRSWKPFSIIFVSNDPTKSTFIDFNNNMIKTIKSLKEIISIPNEKLRQIYERKNFDLSAFFLFCQKKFKEVKSAFFERKLLFITNDADPVKCDQTQRFASINEAKNFMGNNILLELITMTDNFDYNIFYNELFSVANCPLIENVIEDKEGLFEKLSSSIKFRVSQRRIKFYPFNGDSSRFLKCTQKSFISKTKIYKNAAMSTDGRLLKKVRPTGVTLKTYKLKRCRTIVFDVEERYNTLDSTSPTGYTLMCVSDRVSEVGLVFKNPKILEIDPMEKLNFFNSFWQYCVDKDKVLICMRKLRQPDKIRFVEFIPKFANNSRIFLIQTIPFKNFRKPLPTKFVVTKVHSEEEKVEITNQLINSLTFDYNPVMFIHPSLAKKKAFFSAKLLDEEREDVEDLTLNKEAMDLKMGDLGKKFASLLGLDKMEVPSKRKATTSSGRNQKHRKFI